MLSYQVSSKWIMRLSIVSPTLVILPRETRERWTLLTVETVVNWDSWSTYEWGPFLVVCWARCAGTRDFCPGLAALVDPVQNILFLAAHYFTSFILIAQQTRQAVVTRRLSFNMFLRFCRISQNNSFFFLQ